MRLRGVGMARAGTDVLGHVRHRKGPGREAPAVRRPCGSSVFFGCPRGYKLASVRRAGGMSVPSLVSIHSHPCKGLSSKQ